MCTDATRGFALRLILLFGMTGFLLTRKHFEAGLVWMGFGALVILAGLIRPTWLNPLHHGMTALGHWLRARITHAALVLLYYAVLTPVALVARLFGKRFLELQIDPQAESYFIRRDKKSLADYEKGY
jgi:Saxitoxin biosynthesis operon protein SxtJ